MSNDNINIEMVKRPDIVSYSKWVRDKFNVEIDGVPSSVYEFVTSRLLRDFQACGFWTELVDNLNDYNDEYYLKHEYQLLKIEEIPIDVKKFSSVINKSYRKNILLNSNYPEPPSSGWILPDNWFVEIKDILRTMMTVKYLDGVEFLVDKIRQLSEKHKYDFYVDYEAREEGYYAAHITIRGGFIIVDENWDEKEVMFPIEIQITTQLQEVIKKLLHKMYEEDRISQDLEADKKWQWDYKCKEFSSNYLGHILHYVEGMILEVRDKQKNK
jgi:hypothetical protein